jgi:preprotein translocase subunit SecA
LGLSYLCLAYQQFFRHARPVMERLARHCQAGLPLGSFVAVPRSRVGQALVKVGPNQPCPCGSGRKYKKCCRP